MEATSTSTDTMRLSFNDWDKTKSVRLAFPSEASVAEAIEEAREQLALPGDVFYQALQGDRQLDGLSTLRDAGLRSDEEIDLMPDVKAG